MENTGNRNYLLYIPSAILGFLIALFLCLSNPCRADAAIEGVDYAEVLSVAQASISEHLGANYADTYPYYVMIDYAAKNRVNVLFFTGQASVRYSNSLAGFPYDMSGYYVRVYLDDLHVDNLNTSYFCCFASLDDIVYCNYDVMYNGSVVKYAEEPYVPYVTVPLLDTYVDVPMGSYKYYLVLYDAGKYDAEPKNFTRVFLSDEPLQGIVENGAVTLRGDKKIAAYGMDTSRTKPSEYLASYVICHDSSMALTTNGYSDYASNYDLSYNDKVYLPAKPYVKVTPTPAPTPTLTPAPTPTPVPELTYRYDSSAAVPVISGYAKNQYPNGNGVGTVYVDGNTDFRNVYNSGQGAVDAKPEVYVDYTVEIAFPSVDYVNHLLTEKEVAGALDGIGIIEGSENYMLSRSVYINWLSSLGKDGNAEYYTVSGRYSYFNYTSFKNRGVFEFSPDDALSSRFSSTQDLKDYYRLTDKEWKAVGKYVVLFATPVSCTARLGYRVSDTEYVYGDTSTVVFSTDGSGKTLVSSVVSGDVITDADIRRENDFILKKYAMETGSVIGSVSDVSGAFENLGGSDIWATFKSATTGLMTMASSVSHIAVAIGAVFSFLPGGVYNLMYLTLMIVLVCAIIRAIRG